MTVQINELVIRAEIVKQEGKMERQTNELPDIRVREMLKKKALNEDKKKRER